MGIHLVPPMSICSSDYSSNSLKSGRDYPGTWTQFLQWFPDENACLNQKAQGIWQNQVKTY